MKWNDTLVSREQLEAIVRQAGKILATFYTKPLHEQQKNDGSFATEADLASEKFLIDALKKLKPDAGFWAEESGVALEKNQRYYWAIDPLDGTNNYASHVPVSCISVALVDEKIPVVGMIYDFHRDELFAACKGCGSYLNGASISVAGSKGLRDSLVGMPIPYLSHKKAQEWPAFWSLMQTIYAQGAVVRVYGSTALDLAYVAAGRLDVALIDSLSWWDVAAGILLVSEAGGVTVSFQGREIGPDFVNLIATRRELYEQFKPILQGKI